MDKPKNIPASIQQRLKNTARLLNRPYNEILQYYGIERLIYRISRSEYADRFVLKGALMFLVWNGFSFRPTRDIDFLGFTDNDPDAINQIFKEICRQEIQQDGLDFDPEANRSERIGPDSEYEGVRIHLRALLGQAKIALQVDIGFGDIVSPAPYLIDFPSLLNMDSPRILGYPKSSIVAEKVHAMVYLGDMNSRMKDYFDLWFLATTSTHVGRELQTAFSRTFKNRKTDIPMFIPVGLTAEFADRKQVQWRAFLKRINPISGPESFKDVIKVLADFVIPVFDACSHEKILAEIWYPDKGWIEEADNN